MDITFGLRNEMMILQSMFLKYLVMCDTAFFIPIFKHYIHINAINKNYELFV